jgi:phosphoribosylglycinamide formyltransferase-1
MMTTESEQTLKEQKLKLGVLVSGRGSNLQAIIEAIAREELPAEIVVVISNRGDAYALQRAEYVGIRTAVMERSSYASRDAQQAAMLSCLREYGAELVVLAGFDRIIESDILRAYPNAVVNIHPSLLPAFAGGLHAQAEAVAYGVKVSGCTVHFVNEEVDAGPIIAQEAVPVLDTDSAEDLAARILVEEHKLLPEALRLIAEGRVKVQGRRVVITN